MFKFLQVPWRRWKDTERAGKAVKNEKDLAWDILCCCFQLFSLFVLWLKFMFMVCRILPSSSLISELCCTGVETQEKSEI